MYPVTNMMFNKKLTLVTYSVLSFVLISLGTVGSVLAGGGAGDYLPPSQNQQSVTPHIRVIVMPDDSDPKTFRRLHDIHRRVIAELRRPLKHKGFVIVDEEMIAATLGYRITERRPKIELIQTARQANTASDANVHSRILVIYRLYAYVEDLRFSKRVRLRLDGEIYDLLNGTFIDSFEIPVEQTHTFPVPADCNRDCILERTGSKARSLSTSLGEVLARQLRLHIRKMGLSTCQGCENDGGTQLAAGYNLLLRNFKTSEMLRITSTLRNGLSGAVKLKLIERRPLYRRYHYVTKQDSDEFEENILKILRDLDFNLDQDLAFSFKGNRFMVERLNY